MSNSAPSKAELQSPTSSACVGVCLCLVVFQCLPHSGNLPPHIVQFSGQNPHEIVILAKFSASESLLQAQAALGRFTVLPPEIPTILASFVMHFFD